MNERLYIQKILKGDTSAFSYFVDTYQDMAITIAYRICSNRQDAEDIVQNAFVKAFHNLHTFRSDSKFSTWFYRIVYNTAISQIKTSIFNTEFIDYRQMDTEDSYSDWDIINEIEENEQKATISKAMDMLPKDESLLLSLYYIDDNPVKEIVKIVGLSEANVKVKLHRARKRLGDIIQKFVRQGELQI